MIVIVCPICKKHESVDFADDIDAIERGFDCYCEDCEYYFGIKLNARYRRFVIDNIPVFKAEKTKD